MPSGPKTAASSFISLAFAAAARACAASSGDLKLFCRLSCFVPAANVPPHKPAHVREATMRTDSPRRTMDLFALFRAIRSIILPSIKLGSIKEALLSTPPAKNLVAAQRPSTNADRRHRRRTLRHRDPNRRIRHQRPQIHHDRRQIHRNRRSRQIRHDPRRIPRRRNLDSNGHDPLAFWRLCRSPCRRTRPHCHAAGVL